MRTIRIIKGAHIIQISSPNHKIKSKSNTKQIVAQIPQPIKYLSPNRYPNMQNPKYGSIKRSSIQGP